MFSIIKIGRYKDYNVSRLSMLVEYKQVVLTW